MVRLLSLLTLLTLVSSSCKPPAEATNTQPEKANTNRWIFQVKGVVIEVKPKEKSVQIRHEAVPGYMPAMTMAFDVKDANELIGLEPGSSVSFRLIDSGKEGWIDQIRKIAPPATNSSSAPLRIVRDVEPLQIGDVLPDYHFTNQFGEVISTAQFKGNVL